MRLCVRSASEVAVDMPVLVEAGVRSSARASFVRARSVDCSSSVVCTGSMGSTGGGGGGWKVGDIGGGVKFVGEGVSDAGSACEVSVSSDGVSSPRISSPSDVSSSSASYVPSYSGQQILDIRSKAPTSFSSCSLSPSLCRSSLFRDKSACNSCFLDCTFILVASCSSCKSND